MLPFISFAPPVLAPPSFPAPASLPHEDLLRGPEQAFGAGWWSELWVENHAAGRRLYALRKALGSHNVRQEIEHRAGADVLRVKYLAPAGSLVPAIETRKAVMA